MYLRIHNKYPLKYIGNMDETPMWFDLPSNTTINQKGAKTVNIHTTSHKRTVHHLRLSLDVWLMVQSFLQFVFSN